MISANLFNTQYISSIASNTLQGATGGFGVAFLFAIDYMSTPNFRNSPLYARAGLILSLPVVLTVTTVAGGVMGFVGGVRASPSLRHD